MKKKGIFIWLFLFTCISIGAFFSYKYYQDCQEAKRQKILLEKRKASWQELRQILANEIAKFKGQAGIVIKDLEMNWEISFNKDRLFPSASLVKIPIMISCFYAVKERKIKLDDKLKLKLTDKVPGSGILKDVTVGTEFDIEELIEFMISDSDNTATNMLIHLLGFDYFNRTFKEFGLKNTNLARKMMDFKYRKQGVENYTTAEDIAYILEKFYRKEFLRNTVSQTCLKLLKQQRVNDRIPAKVLINIVIAHKTGLERNVCHDAGIVFTCKGNFLICVLTKEAGNSKLAKEFISEVAFNNTIIINSFKG